MASIIIPAHNEEKVVGRCLHTLLAEAKPGEFEVVVVSNGSTDRTAAEAKGVADEVHVVETAVPSKIGALNLGDRIATRFPRVYVDADIVMTTSALRRLVAVLHQDGEGHANDNGGGMVAGGRMKVDLHDRPWMVRAFYRIWFDLPYMTEGMVGSGVYALSEAGRSRFGDFPEVIADDGYIRLLFAPSERKVAVGAEFTVAAPRTLWGLIKIKTRAHQGDLELWAIYPGLSGGQEGKHRGPLLRLICSPPRWPSLAVYLLVRAVSRFRARRAIRKGSSRWERDDSSRIQG